MSLADDARWGANNLEVNNTYASLDSAIALLVSCADEFERLTAELSAITQALDFEPDENHHTIADMANVGRSLMERLPKDYNWNETPAEIVSVLCNQLDDCRAERDALRGQVAAIRDALTQLLSVLPKGFARYDSLAVFSLVRETVRPALENTEAAALAHDKEVRNRALEEAAVKLLADAEAYRARGVNPWHLEQVDAVMGAARALSNAVSSILAMKETT